MAYVLFGASSAIANAYLATIAKHDPKALVVCVSRSIFDTPYGTLNIQSFKTDYSQSSLRELTTLLETRDIRPKQVVIFNGQLHFEHHLPEKKLEDINESYFSQLLTSNTLIPLLCLQAIVPRLNHQTHCSITSLSARVGSISDNQLGGWYSYRASKAALNMLFKSAAIELARRAKNTRLILFHPGTTDTALSKPFQRNVPQGKLFTPEFVADCLYSMLDCPEKLTDPGDCAYIDYQGNPIAW